MLPCKYFAVISYKLNILQLWGSRVYQIYECNNGLFLFENSQKKMKLKKVTA